MSIAPAPAPTQVATFRPSGRTRIISIIMIVIGLLTALVFGLGSAASAHSSLTFTPINLANAPWHLGTLTLLTRWTNVILGLITVALGAEVFLRQPRRGVMVRFGVVAVLFLLALLLWASRAPGPSQVGYVNVTAVLIGSSEVAMVLIFGALSGLMCERSGVVNIAIEGQYIGGAFFGSVIASTTHDFFLAAIAGMVAGLVAEGRCAENHMVEPLPTSLTTPISRLRTSSAARIT